MLKWFKGFISGAFLTIGIATITIVGLYIWLLKNIREETNKTYRVKYH